MSNDSGPDPRRTKPDKLQMLVFGAIVVATLLRLPSQDSGWPLWVNVLLLLVGVAGFAVAALRPELLRGR